MCAPFSPDVLQAGAVKGLKMFLQSGSCNKVGDVTVSQNTVSTVDKCFCRRGP